MRNKALFLLIGLCALVFIAQAQKDPLFNFGVKAQFDAGFGVPHGKPKIGTIDSTKASPEIGSSVGAFVLLTFSNKLSAWAEINYQRRAMNYSARAKGIYYAGEQCISLPDGSEVCMPIESEFTGTTWGKFDNHYIEIPIMFRYSFNSKWHAMLGFYDALLLESKSFVKYDGFSGVSPYPIQSEEDLSKQTTENNFGLKLGGQYRIKQLLVDLRFTYGFTSIYKEDYKPIDYPIRDLYAELGVSYLFRKPK